MSKLARAFVMAAIITTAPGCGGDSGTNVNGSNSISAQIDGVAWSGSSVSASYQNYLLVVSGTDAQQKKILITLPVTTTGTYSFGAGSTSVGTINFGTQVWVTSLAGGSGGVVVTSLTSTHAAGTFTFIAPATATTGATGSKTITNGVFDVSF